MKRSSKEKKEHKCYWRAKERVYKRLQHNYKWTSEEEYARNDNGAYTGDTSYGRLGEFLYQPHQKQYQTEGFSN